MRMQWWQALGLGIGALLVLGALYVAIQSPSNDRIWQSDLARLPGVTVISDHAVAVPSLRDWTLEPDWTAHEDYRSETYDTDNLERVWFFVEPRPGSKVFAHTFFSFDFAGKAPLVVSVEARKEASEPNYSATKGLFRKYELMYIWSSEPDAIGRTLKYADRDLFMYPLVLSKAAAAKLFMTVARDSQAAEAKPRFYNSLFDNCTSSLADAANEAKPGSVPWSWARIFTGYSDDYLLKLGYIATSSLAHPYISTIARNASNADLSAAIRAYVLKP